jgi:hypothetical protein
MDVFRTLGQMTDINSAVHSSYPPGKGEWSRLQDAPQIHGEAGLLDSFLANGSW